MKITYRPASESDFQDLTDLLAQLGYEVDRAVLGQRIASIRERGGEVLVADSEERVVGCVNAILDIRLAAGQMGEIVSLVVDSQCRGTGIGKALVLHAVSWLEEAGCKRVRVRANVTREAAHRFYEKLGFEELKTQKIFIR